MILKKKSGRVRVSTKTSGSGRVSGTRWALVVRCGGYESQTFFRGKILTLIGVNIYLFSSSGLKCLIRPWTGQAAPSARAQMVWPSICNRNDNIDTMTLNWKFGISLFWALPVCSVPKSYQSPLAARCPQWTSTSLYSSSQYPRKNRVKGVFHGKF